MSEESNEESNVSLLKIPLDKIRPNAVASLRAVNQETEKYAQMVQSIKQQGVLSSITARPATDPETGEEYYELIDGLHRCTAAKEAGLTTIPATIRAGMDDSGVLEAQLIANAHKIETKPVEYSKHLERILTLNPMMTEAELATRLGRSVQWLRERLRINKIENEQILKLVDEGKICLNNACALAKLPEEEQPDWIARAIEEGAQEFLPAVQKRVKEIKDAQRKGKDAAPAEFSPTPYCQKVSVLKEELESRAIGSALVGELGITDPVEAFNLAIQWTLHMDPKSIEEAKAKYEQKQAEAAERRKKIAEQRAEKKAQKKAEEAAAAQAEAQAVKESNAS